MTVFYEWALSEGIPFEAIRRLEQRLGTFSPPVPGAPGLSEAAVQSALRLRVSAGGGVAWRNNVGAGRMDTGSFVRFGLANDSPAMNRLIKSSDLVGIQPVLVTPGHVGMRIGQFWAREVKRGGWAYSGTAREVAQLRFMELVNALGGDAAFASD